MSVSSRSSRRSAENTTTDPAAGPPDSLDETIALWQPLSARRLTREDARQIVENLKGFFGVLREWEAEKRKHDASAGPGEAA